MVDIDALFSVLSVVAPSAYKILEPHLKAQRINEKQITIIMLGAIMEANTKLERVISKLTEIANLNAQKLDLLLDRDAR